MPNKIINLIISLLYLVKPDIVATLATPTLPVCLALTRLVSQRSEGRQTEGSRRGACLSRHVLCPEHPVINAPCLSLKHRVIIMIQLL